MKMIPFDVTDSLGVPRLLSRTDLIRVVLRLQFEGWDRALRQDPELTANQDEPYMNGRLFQGMMYVRNCLGLTNIYILETPSIRSDTTRPLPDGEPDMGILFSAFGTNDPHALIECKRLDPREASRQLRGDYVRKGIDRFVKGRYGNAHEIDFMVAYVLRGDEHAAMEDVNSYLRNVRRVGDSLRSNGKFQSIGFVAQSDHIRMADDVGFKLLHSFVGFWTS